MRPGLVDWTRVKKNPLSVFHAASNPEYAISLCSSLRCNLSGITGSYSKISSLNMVGKDIYDEGNKKLITAVLEELRRSWKRDQPRGSI